MVIFTVSKKLIKSKKFFIILGVFIILLTTVLFVVFRDNPNTAEFDGKTYSLRADSDKEISEFADFFGLKIDDEPMYMKNILIPSNFNNIYLQYNDLQKQIGLNLEKYRGQSCTLYSYAIISPENKKNCVLNLIIHNDIVIGGDISEREYGGKIFGLGDKKEVNIYK